MPELLEVETYRAAAAAVVGRRIASVAAPDPLVLSGASGRQLGAALRGATVTEASRHGKLMVLDTDGPAVGIHFGMTGRLLVDGTAAIERLEYSSGRDVAAWDRLTLRFDDGGELLLRDPRRLARVSLDPDLGRLGPDAGMITKAGLATVLRARRAPLKAVLMDQGRLAGMGNLLTDETLWRAGFAPTRPAGDLSAAEVGEVWRAMRTTLRVLGRRGGSHTGDTFPERRPQGRCPADGAEMRRDTVGGRTTWWCPQHQR